MTIVLIIVLICVLSSLPRSRNMQEKPYNSDYSLCSALDKKMKFYSNTRMGFLKAYMNLFLPILFAFEIYSTYNIYNHPTTTTIEFLTAFGYTVLTALNIYTIRGIDSIAYYINIFWLFCFVFTPFVGFASDVPITPAGSDMFTTVFNAVLQGAFLLAVAQMLVIALCVFFYMHKRRDLFCCTKSELEKQYDEMRTELQLVN